MIARELLEGIGGYSGLFFFCAASGIVLPVPEDVALLYAGMRVESGEAAWVPTWIVAMAGVLSRDAMAYGIGRLLGDWVLDHRLVRRVIGARKLDRARHLVEERGSRAVMTGRFLIGFRAPVFMACGAARVPFARFAAWDLLGLAIAVPAAVALGYVFGSPIIDGAFWLLARIRTTGLIVIALAAIGAIAWIVSNRDEGDDEPVG